jgi:hypothetical protein
MTEIIREYKVGRFHGDFPDIEPAEGVDLEGIRQSDPNAMFVTLPIAEIGAVSGNGLLYDEQLVDSIAEQINAKRPGGIFGHLKDEERSTSFPLPAALWVGAKRVGRTLYAKGYIPPGAARDYIATLKRKVREGARWRQTPGEFFLGEPGFCTALARGVGAGCDPVCDE